MSDVTRILVQIDSGNRQAADQLLPLVYEELRKLAAAKMSNQAPGQTLQPTALVHEAFLRLVDVNEVQSWDSRGHFFAAAAEAMRRILVDRYRERASQKRGGDRRRVELKDADLGAADESLDLVALNDAIERLETTDPRAAELAKLRLFAGMSIDDAGKALGIPHTSAYREWAYAQAWLQARLSSDSE